MRMLLALASCLCLAGVGPAGAGDQPAKPAATPAKTPQRPKPGDAPATPATAPARDTAASGVIKIEKITLLPVDQNALDRAVDFRKQAENADNEANRLSGTNRTPPPRKDGKSRSSGGRNSSRVKELREHAKSLRAKAEALEREAKVPKHRIEGYDGARTVVLTTQTDQTSTLNKFAPGQFLAWKGVRVSIDEKVESCTAASLNPAEKPSGWTDRK
jgi:hypothetical protein